MHMTSDDVITALSNSYLKGVVSLFDDDEFAQIISMTEADTKWVLPFDGADKSYWFVRRATRHALFCLCITYAHKFKYKQINLNQRFEHYMTLVASEDKAWENVDLPCDTAEERIAQFGHVASAGFRYGPTGEDITYHHPSHVRFNPKKD
jgi:hypothetical protein